jgi:hypothetical protein
MSVAQTKFIGLCGTSPANHYRGGAAIGPAAADWSIAIFVQSIRAVANAGVEPIFSTLSGNTGVRISRLDDATNEEVQFQASIGRGGAITNVNMTMRAPRAIGAGFVAHLTHEVATDTVRWYMQGALRATSVLAGPYVPSGINPYLGSDGIEGNQSTSITAVGLATSLMSLRAVYNNTARAIMVHDLPADGTFAHLWSFQQRGLRSLPATLADTGTLADAPLARVGLGGTERRVSDVGYICPIAPVG